MIRINDFKGEIPARARTLLPQGFAERCVNAMLEDGTLTPFRKATVAASAPQGTKTIFRHQGEWLSWPSEVHAAPGPVAQDRLYIMGDGAPKMRVNGATYDLALHGPQAAPVVTPVNPQVNPELNDPNAAIDLSAFDLPPVVEGSSGSGAGVPARIVVARAIIINPVNFYFQLGMNQTPIIHVLDEFNDLCTTDNSTRVTMRLVSNNATMTPVSATAVGGIITFPPHNNLLIPLNTGVLTFRFSPDSSSIDTVDYTTGDEIEKVDSTASRPGEVFRIAIARQPEGGISGKTLVTQPAIVLLDINDEICEGVDGYEVSCRTSFETGGALTGKRTAASKAGVVRFTDLSASQDGGLPMILEFFSDKVQAITSDEIFLEPDKSATAKDVLFTYTFVTEFDEESPPAPLTESIAWYPGLILSLGGFSPPQSGRAINRIRVYRSETSISGITDLYFVKEIQIADLANGPAPVYDSALHPLGEVLPSNDYDPPEADVTGLVTLPNGFFAAFNGRELLFSEPFRPHAWPVKYRLSVDYEIVGLVVFGSALVVLTTENPYIAQGYEPSTLRLERVDQSMPCVSSRSIVDLGYAAAFATHDGLAIIDASQGARIITKGIFTIDQWRDMNPASMRAMRHRGSYMFAFDHLDGPEQSGLCFISLDEQKPFVSFGKDKALALFAAPSDGEAYVLDETGAIRQWNSRKSPPETYVWKSGVLSIGALVNFGAILIKTDQAAINAPQQFSVSVYADDRKVIEIKNTDKPERLPSGFLSDKWQFEISGNLRVTELIVAGDISQIAGA